jgi:hypothetical protein
MPRNDGSARRLRRTLEAARPRPAISARGRFPWIAGRGFVQAGCAAFPRGQRSIGSPHTGPCSCTGKPWHPRDAAQAAEVRRRSPRTLIRPGVSPAPFSPPAGERGFVVLWGQPSSSTGRAPCGVVPIATASPLRAEVAGSSPASARRRREFSFGTAPAFLYSLVSERDDRRSLISAGRASSGRPCFGGAVSRILVWSRAVARGSRSVGSPPDGGSPGIAHTRALISAGP